MLTFKTLRRPAIQPLHSKATPAEAVMSAAILQLAALADTQNGYRFSYEREAAIVRRHEKLGFNNTQECRNFSAMADNVVFCNFICKVWEVFGKNSLLVKIDHFNAILKKFDLMAVTPDRYIGSIPLDHISEIEKAVTRLGSGEHLVNSFNDTENAIAWVDNSEALIEFLRLPLRRNEGKHAFFISPALSGNIFIAAPKELVLKPTIKTYTTHNGAIFKIMEQIKDYTAEQTIEQLKPIPESYDPFIFSVCPHGVIIHTMWGSEAEGTTINRYSQLRDTIIQNFHNNHK